MILALVLPERAQGQDSGVPARPTGLTGTATHNSVTLAWDNAGDASITSYQILRRDTAVHEIGIFVILEDNTGTLSTTFTDTNVEPEHRYVYRVKARNSAGLSPRSSYFNMHIPAAPPDPTPTSDPTETPTPTHEPTETPTPTPELTPVPTPASTQEPAEPTTENTEAVNADADSTSGGAIDLGDITSPESAIYPTYVINGEDDVVDYFTFTLTEPKFVTVGIRQLDADASVTVERDDGTVIKTNSEPGAQHVMTYGTMLEGTYYIRVEADESGQNEYRLAHGVRGPDPDKVAELRQQSQQPRPPSVTQSGNGPPGSDTQDPDQTLTALPATVDEDCSDNASTVCVITVGSSMPAAIGTEGDVDWIKVALTADTPYRIEISADLNTGVGLDSPQLWGIFSAGGGLLRNTEPNLDFTHFLALRTRTIESG